MKVSRETIKSAFRNASKTFFRQWEYSREYRAPKDHVVLKEQFWKDFGNANNMNVIIDGFKYDYPVLNDTIEFNTEQDYLMFMLRWS